MRVTIGRTFKLEQIVEAHRAMEENTAACKIVPGLRQQANV